MEKINLATLAAENDKLWESLGNWHCDESSRFDRPKETFITEVFYTPRIALNLALGIWKGNTGRNIPTVEELFSKSWKEIMKNYSNNEDVWHTCKYAEEYVPLTYGKIGETKSLHYISRTGNTDLLLIKGDEGNEISLHFSARQERSIYPTDNWYVPCQLENLDDIKSFQFEIKISQFKKEKLEQAPSSFRIFPYKGNKYIFFDWTGNNYWTLVGEFDEGGIPNFWESESFVFQASELPELKSFDPANEYYSSHYESEIESHLLRN